MANVLQVPPIARGYGYAIQTAISGGGAIFPTGATLKAGIRDYLGAPMLLGELTTADGSIVVVDPQTLQLSLMPALTVSMTNSACVLDLVRTDTPQEQWLGVQITLPVVSPVTPP